MQSKAIVLVLVVVGAIFLGVTMTVQQINSPIMQRLVEQQTEILKLQRKLDQQFAGQPAQAQGGDSEKRWASLEEKIDGLVSFFKQARQQQAPDAPTDEYTKVHTIDIGSSPVSGKKDAPVTIVEYVDFQCPFCARFHPAIKDVLNAYPDKVNHVIKNFPLSFHPIAKPAAKAALAAGEQGKYYDMADAILKDNSNLSDAKFEELAKQIGLNMKKFKDDLKSKDAEYEKTLQADFDQGTQVDVRGTPTYFINGRKTIARDLNTYKKEIDAILQKAQ